MRLRVGDALIVVSTKTGADMGQGHDRMVTRLYSLRKPTPNVAAFGRAGEGHTGALTLIFIDIPKGRYQPPMSSWVHLQTLSRGFLLRQRRPTPSNKTCKANVREATGENSE